MTTQNKMTWVLFVFTCFCAVMEIVRMWYSEALVYIFLPWNLVLAWVPYLLSLKFIKLNIVKRRTETVITLFLWVLFLPNGPYIITDLIHLRHREPIPMWYDVMLVSTYAWNGLLLTLVSVRNIHRKLQDHLSPVTLWTGLAALFMSAGYGIYLGRFLRWNSWEVFYRPFFLLHYSIVELIHPFHHPRPILVTVIVGVVLSFSYLIFYLMEHKTQEHEII